MIKISILYPHTPGSRFDVDYYVDTHMPGSVQLLSAHPGFRGVSVERGVGGATPGSPPTYAATCHFLFDSMDSFVAAFTPHAAQLQGDMPNYTDVQPVIQFGEVMLAR